MPEQVNDFSMESETFSDAGFLRTIYALGAPNNIPIVLLHLARKPENAHSLTEFIDLVKQTCQGDDAWRAIFSADNHLTAVLSRIGVVNKLPDPEISYSIFSNFSIDPTVAEFLKKYFLGMAGLYPLADFSFAAPTHRESQYNASPSKPTQNFLRIAEILSEETDATEDIVISTEAIFGENPTASQRMTMYPLVHDNFVEPIREMRGRGNNVPTIAYRMTPKGIDTSNAIWYIARQLSNL